MASERPGRRSDPDGFPLEDTDAPAMDSVESDHAPADAGVPVDGFATHASHRGPWRYEILDQFDEGGTCTVHRARDRQLGRVVALKVLRPGLSLNDVARTRFAVEAQVTAQLDHPGIVPIHDLGQTPDGRAYIAMKLVEGRTLRMALNDALPVPAASGKLEAFLGVFLKVCETVSFAHSRGVVHRDIKPENVVVGSYGAVYVMDWGIARVMDAAVVPDGVHVSIPRNPRDPDARGAPMGTPRYMAPEQAHAHLAAIDARTDVFALGAMLYEMLTGAPLYEGATQGAVLSKAMLAAIPPPESLTGGVAVAPALGQVALRAMARAPEERYPTVQALQEDVELFMRGAARFPTATYAPGSLVIVEGEPGDEAYVITQGRCVAFKTVQGARVNLREMGPGEVFGETAVISEVPRTASVQVLEALTVMVVSRAFLSEGLGLQTWMGRFVKVLADRFRDLDARLTALDPARGGGTR